jgi:hypothetical protein
MLPDTGIDDVKQQRNAEYAKHINDPVLSSLNMEGISLLFYLQFDINCDKVQMRPYHFLLARPSFVLRWQPAYAGREFRSTSIFQTDRNSASDFKLGQEESVTDSSFEFQCDSMTLEKTVMEHIEKSMFPAWFLFVTEISPWKRRLFYITQEIWSMFWVEIFVIRQIWVAGNRHKYVRNKTIIQIKVNILPNYNKNEIFGYNTKVNNSYKIFVRTDELNSKNVCYRSVWFITFSHIANVLLISADVLRIRRT